MNSDENRDSRQEAREFSTGAFARLAGVSERTLRYYDKKNLLKPSAVLPNGYRRYTADDLEQLQKILMFKNLGFSLDEISILLLDSKKDLIESLRLQKRLVLERMNHLRTVNSSLDRAIASMQSTQQPEQSLIELISVIRKDDELVEQYKNASNLRIRENLHRLYSAAPVPWFDWIMSQIAFSHVNRLLEIGCGSGRLWKSCRVSLRNRDIFLSDRSEGMVEEARQLLNSRDFSFMVIDAMNIPFKDGYFDALIANHVLFYLPDIAAGLKEAARVLKPGGVLYATAYGKNHMREVTELVQEFDPEIYLSSERLYEKFGIENGESLLKEDFEDIRFHSYDDHLEVTKAEDLADYILSCHGNQNEPLKDRYGEFIDFLRQKLDEKGMIYITKQAGLFTARRPLPEEQK